MKAEYRDEHIRKVEEGQRARQFLESPGWIDFIKPIIDSMVKGLTDARGIDTSSDKKASIEVKSRTLAADYLEQIEKLLNGFVEDGEISARQLEKDKNSESLYRETDEP